MKVAFVGLRGFPGVQGGIETHCEHLATRLATLGTEVIVYGRRGYLKQKEAFEFEGVQIVPLPCIHKQVLETATYMFLCIWRCLFLRPGIVHIHGIGPALFVPAFRLLGAKVVVTHHGPDYERAKWGLFAKSMLRLGELVGCATANKVIAISAGIQAHLTSKFKFTHTVLIRNGVVCKATTMALPPFDLQSKGYVLAVGRFVEEKGFSDLLNAWEQTRKSVNLKLVIAGKADIHSKYAEALEQRAAELGVVLPGFVVGKDLEALYANALLFVLPSLHEGLPIVLLEAMSYNLDIVASDIPANKEVPLPEECFYSAGSVEDLVATIESHLAISHSQNYESILHRRDYDWDKIAKATIEVYHSN